MAAIAGMRVRWRWPLLLSLLGAIAMAYYYVAILLPATRATEAHPIVGRASFGNDFYPLWLTSRECVLHPVDPYSRAISDKIQIGIFGRAYGSRDSGDPPLYYHAFAYPAFADIFGLPVAWLAFPAARIVLVIALPALTAWGVFLWAKGLGWKAGSPLFIIFTVLFLSSYPELEALYALQPAFLVGLLLAAAFAALAQGKPQRAGILLALSTIKPQVSALLILYLMMWSLAAWKERRKFALSFLFTLATLTLLPMLTWPNWIAHWTKMLVSYSEYSRPPLLFGLFGRYIGSALLMLPLGAILKFVWYSRGEIPTSFRFGLTVSLLLALTTVTLLPEHAFYEQGVLLPGIMLVARSWNAIWSRNLLGKWILVLAVGALLWSWIASAVVIVVRTLMGYVPPELTFLPIRTAAAIPFVVLALLVLMLRRAKDFEVRRLFEAPHQ